MCITHPAHPSLQQRFAPATPAAAQDTRRGARQVTRTCRSAWQVRRLRIALVASRRAALKHVRGTASTVTATWMTWLAPQWRAFNAWQRRDQVAHTKPHVRRPTSGSISRLPAARGGEQKAMFHKEEGVPFFVENFTIFSNSLSSLQVNASKTASNVRVRV